ncbi:secretory phospholipase A2 receptor isoform X2 [Dendropsophus ebraccatus]|uniref:secretory phospholipase A2 receptor isoform X2 n=1 Tax=Dendropsophus ebraccatus TaxID=150705 RepID=UPI003831F72D
MSALLLPITGLLCGILVPYTSAQLPEEIRDGCDILWETNNVTLTCYQFNLQSVLSWKAARESCQAQGGDLLSIVNLAEQNYLSERLKDADIMLWIGLNQLDGLGGWQWSDGAALALINWKTDSIPWSYERRHCGTYYAGGEHKWHSSECESRLPYACKKYLTPRRHELYENWKYYPTQCESDWIPYNQRCCRLLREELSWSEASAACQRDGGELIAINSLADVEFLVHLLDHENVSEAWIGMSSTHWDPIEFQWSDGSVVTFSSWQRHEPNISLEDSDLCVSAQRADGNWKVRPCRRNLFSVCKKPALSETMDVTDGLCAENWVRYDAYCYGTDFRNQTFLQSVGDLNCPLATITNRFEQAFINSLISSKIIPGDSYFWIALQDINKTGEYRWLLNGRENQDVRFTNWGTQEPSQNGGCVVLSTGRYMGSWSVKDCKGFTAKSLCKQSLDADFERQQETSKPQQGNVDQACELSWETEPHLHHCYKVFHHEKLVRKRTWQEAEDLCQDFGAHLVSLSHSEEEEFLDELLHGFFSRHERRRFWIGLNKRNPSSKDSWEWSDGSPVLSSFRSHINPNVSSNCAAYGADTQFVPLHCNTREEWICKIPKGVIPKSPDWHIRDVPWVFYQGHNYYLYETKVDFASAEFVCGWLRSGVTSILTEDEQAFLHRRIKKISKEKQNWWIGLVNDYDGFQRWGDGSSAIYTNWRTDPQSNSRIAVGDKQCVYMESDTGLWSKSDCHSPNPVICKTKIMFKIEKHHIPMDKDPDQEHGICPKGWLYYASKCFFVYKDGIMMDWYAASTFCTEHDGGLATITNEIEQAFILVQLFGQEEGFWIGVSKSDYEQWENGTEEAYSNWTPTRYTHNGVHEEDQLCALISANHNVHPPGKWYLEKCSPKGHRFVCEKEQDISDPAMDSSDMFPVSETMEYGDKTYRIISGNRSWYEASSACQESGGTLVSITDQYHQAFVTILVHRLGYPHWIGFFRDDNGDDFRWVDDSMSLFTSWEDEESLSDRSCVYIDTSGYWRTEDCDTKLQGALCLPSTGPRYNQSFDACREGWIPLGPFCYSIYTALHNKQFYEAEELCTEEGGDILTVLSEEEEYFIRYQVKTLTSVQSVWLKRIVPLGSKEVAWSDGSIVRYSKWNEETTDVHGLAGNLISTTDTRIYTATDHVIIPIAVVSTMVISILLIFMWYLLKRKRCLSGPNIQRLQYTESSPDSDNVQLYIPIADLNNRGNQ